MARPARDIDPEARFAVFAQALRGLRTQAGSPTYQVIAARAGYSKGTVSEIFGGQRLPTWDVLCDVIQVCGGDPVYWREQWMLARLGVTARAANTPVLSMDPPDPGTAKDVQDFLLHLRTLRTWAGDPSLSRIARRTELGKSTVGAALASSRKTLPTLWVAQQIVHCLLAEGPEITEPAEDYFARWSKTWRRLRTDRARSEPSEPVAATTSTDTPAQRITARPGRPYAPVSPYVPQARQELAEAARKLLELSGHSLRVFSRAVHRDASTVSRYLSGQRLPDERFLHELHAFAEHATGGKLTVPPAELMDLYRRALQADGASSSMWRRLEYRVTALSELLASAQEELQRLTEERNEQRASQPAAYHEEATTAGAEDGFARQFPSWHSAPAQPTAG
ncbi:helix-turn-helix domain-containing protein [Streptomyces sp. NPDC048710]|uniref:helix-turn-helix domain-containing protein n=1 Tax=Streptomyces sp. NPDC048710 TaxID=3365586 RepID=UPI0037228403